MNFDKGKVSIIVPLFNADNYLKDCIDSVLQQTYHYWELLLIDDGSNDGSLEVCKKFSSKDERIKYFSQANSGPSSARNNGLKHATGEFITFLDADDLLLKNYLLTLIRKVEEVDWVVGDYIKVRKNHENLQSGHNLYFKKSKNLNLNELLNYMILYLTKVNKYHLFVHCWGSLFRHSVIKKNNIRFNTELTTFEDVDFNFRYLKFANNVFFINKIIYKHKLHENAGSASMNLRGAPVSLFGYQTALKSAKELMEKINKNYNNRHFGQAYTSYLIIQTMRLTLSINDNNKDEILLFLKTLCKNKTTQQHLSYYKAGKHESKVLPILFRLKWAWGIIKVCQFKANRRYSRDRK